MVFCLTDIFYGYGRAIEVFQKKFDLGEVFRADTKTEGHSVFWIGDWEFFGGVPVSKARWFAIELTRANAPWAFSRGEPFRTIAALELVCTLLCIMIFGDRWKKDASGMPRLSGSTDNRSKSQVVQKFMTFQISIGCHIVRTCCSAAVS